MSTGVALRQARAIRVAWPVSLETLQRLFAGEAAALDCDESLATLRNILDADNPFGDFGAYQAVAEVTPGWELFRPGPAAKPTLGTSGQRAVSPSLTITIHVPAEALEADVDAALERLLAAHPWEVPVIEISEVLLAVRPGAQPLR